MVGFGLWCGDESGLIVCRADGDCSGLRGGWDYSRLPQ